MLRGEVQSVNAQIGKHLIKVKLIPQQKQNVSHSILFSIKQVDTKKTFKKAYTNENLDDKIKWIFEDCKNLFFHLKQAFKLQKQESVFISENGTLKLTVDLLGAKKTVQICTEQVDLQEEQQDAQELKNRIRKLEREVQQLRQDKATKQDLLKLKKQISEKFINFDLIRAQVMNLRQQLQVVTNGKKIKTQAKDQVKHFAVGQNKKQGFFDTREIDIEYSYRRPKRVQQPYQIKVGEGQNFNKSFQGREIIVGKKYNKTSKSSKFLKISQIQPGQDQFNFIAKIVSGDKIKNKVKVVLGDETGIVDGYFDANELFIIGQSIAFIRCEATVFKQKIQIQLMDKGKLHKSRVPVTEVNSFINISAKLWFEEKS